MKYLYYRTYSGYEYAYCDDMLITILESTDVAHRKPFVEIRTEVSDKFRRMFDTRAVEITEPEFFAMRVRAAELIGIAKLTCLMCGTELDSVCSTACREAFDSTLEEEAEEYPGEIRYKPEPHPEIEVPPAVTAFLAEQGGEDKDVVETDGRGTQELSESEPEP